MKNLKITEQEKKSILKMHHSKILMEQGNNTINTTDMIIYNQDFQINATLMPMWNDDTEGFFKIRVTNKDKFEVKNFYAGGVSEKEFDLSPEQTIYAESQKNTNAISVLYVRKGLEKYDKVTLSIDGGVSKSGSAKGDGYGGFEVMFRNLPLGKYVINASVNGVADEVNYVSFTIN